MQSEEENVPFTEEITDLSLKPGLHEDQAIFLAHTTERNPFCATA